MKLHFSKLAFGLLLICGCLMFGGVSAIAQVAIQPDPTVVDTAKKQIAGKLGGGSNSYYSLFLIEAETDIDEVNGVIGFGALALELLAAPITILEGSRGNRDIRPGVFIENSPQVRPPQLSIKIEVLTIRGKDQAITAVMEHLMAGQDSKSIRDWKLVKRSRFKKDAVATSDRVEQHFNQVVGRGQITVLRRPNPDE